jgi:hypothetical protein
MAEDGNSRLEQENDEESCIATPWTENAAI